LIAGISIYAQSTGASTGPPAEPATPAALAATPSGPGRLLRADHVSAANAVPVFTLGNGQQVSVASSGKIRCLLRTVAGHLAGEACADTDINEGARSITVSDECAAGGQNRMEITGLAPEGTTTVRLDYTNDTHEDTTVLDGAFRFEGTNPAPGAAYPTGVEWLSNGVSGGSAPLPVKEDEFCLPAEEPN